MSRPSRKIDRFTDAARVFTILTLLALIYLAIGVTRGLDDPRERAELARNLFEFEVPDGYRLAGAVYMAVSRFAVLLNDSTGQRIRISEPRIGSDTSPEEFLRLYGEVGKPVHRFRNLGGFDEVVTEATGEIVIAGHPCPRIVGIFRPGDGGDEEGEAFLLHCPVTDKSYTIAATAPAGRYSPQETREWLATIRCHPGIQIRRPGSRSSRFSTRPNTSGDDISGAARPTMCATFGFRCSRSGPLWW